MTTPRRHLIITGTGRNGTTFLVQLMTALGMDTGFAKTTDGIYANCHAGMERSLRDPESPYIVKDPRLCTDLDDILRSGIARVDHAIVPMRDLYAAAESRRSVTVNAGDSFGGGEVPGGLWLTDKAAEQENVLAHQFYRLMHTLVAHDIPTTTLLFPRLVADANYLYRKLSGVLTGIDRQQFLVAFNQVARPDLVHDFAARSAT